ncbi:MAG TPA: tRNA (N(6)-L-threonylcarbamoyladenosine(37)-C(2))-methylthiotransferase [Methanomassiliicoccales archaeon]|nr:tRNA (N(6)-L-threonylcarbamoyladenosine(37)-C(2))-methylthiotransferase [Methanomassiliicoccales archaeon]
MRFYVETFGCTMNQGESRDLADALISLGHDRVVSELEADLVLINTCVVIKPTELKIMRRLRQLNQEGKDMIIAGCLPAVQMDVLKAEFPDSIIVPPKDYPGFMEEVRSRLGSLECQHLSTLEEVTGILPVAQGCLGNCTYCLTKKARGHLSSLPADEVIRRARVLLDRGSKELLVTAQDTGCYGQDIGTDISHLISALTAIDGDFQVRVGMMNPDSISGMVPLLVNAWSHTKVYKFIHLPVQSGSESVLKAMGRGYDVKTFLNQVSAFRKVWPKMSMATDIITGFPGETSADHELSLELIRNVRPSTVNVTRFSPRQGTPAAKSMNQVPGWIIKDRSREMAKLRFEISTGHYSQFIDDEISILVTEQGKNGTLIGRSIEYAPVVIPVGKCSIGCQVKVEIIGHAATHLIGRVL